MLYNKSKPNVLALVGKTNKSSYCYQEWNPILVNINVHQKEHQHQQFAGFLSFPSLHHNPPCTLEHQLHNKHMPITINFVSIICTIDTCTSPSTLSPSSAQQTHAHHHLLCLHHLHNRHMHITISPNTTIFFPLYYLYTSLNPKPLNLNV